MENIDEAGFLPSLSVNPVIIHVKSRLANFNFFPTMIVN